MRVLPARQAVALAGSALCIAAAALAAQAVPAADAVPAAPALPAAQAVLAAQPASPRPGWHISVILDPKFTSDLLSLTAINSHDAWAFGDGFQARPTALHWNGSAWTGSGIRGAFTRVGYVSPTGPDNVWAGGSECTGGAPGPDITAAYVARWHGHAWTTTLWKTTAFCGAALVTTGPRNGWLLGNDQALHFTGRHWSKVSLGKVGQVTAATAVSARNIWAIGGRFNGLHLSKSRVFVIHYNGHAWRTVPLPPIKLPRYGYLYPYDIRASSANSIWAPVTIFPAGARTIVLHWNGSKWQSIPLPVTPEQLLQVTPDGHGGIWAIMFPTVRGEYEFAHYARGHWSFDPVPTRGLPGFVPPGVFDLYAISLIPGTESVLATGDTFYSDAENASRHYTLIFRYRP